MIKNDQYRLGSLIIFKKPHPSKTTAWEIVRLGADIKVKSTIKRDVFIMMPRFEFNRKVLEVVKF